jgi:hypothetical protein
MYIRWALRVLCETDLYYIKSTKHILDEKTINLSP